MSVDARNSAVAAQFSVSGRTVEELQQRAEEELGRLMPGVVWAYSLECSPEVQSNNGVVTWEATVTARVAGPT